MPFSDHATLTYTLIGLFSVSALAFLLSQPTVPIRSDLLALHAHADGEIRLQYAAPFPPLP
jgi:hypothetical protein